MAQTTSADGGTERTNTTRHTETVTADELIEGDRIAPELVATTKGQLGQPVSREGPDTGLYAVTHLHTMDDTHSALLVDGESGIIVRAGCHDSSQAWSQKEADWKVYDVGTTVVVEDVHELTLSDTDDAVDGAAEYVESWAQVVIEDPANGHDDYDDDRSLNGRTLTLSDYDGRKAVATISLEGE